MKKMLMLCALVLAATVAHSQSLSKTGVISVKLKNSGPIMSNGSVVGYYSFYDIDKKDRKNNNYSLGITDENLNEIKTINIVRPNTYILVDAIFNGESFGFLFYDKRNTSIELVGYDRNLKEVGKVVKKLENKYGKVAYDLIAQGQQPMQPYIVGVPSKGFVLYGIDNKSKSDFEIEYYDNSMKRKWREAGKDDKYDFENAAGAFQEDEYLGTLIAKRTGLFSMDFEMDLLVQQTTDGKIVFRVPMETATRKLSFSEIFFNKEKHEFIVFGEYFNKEDNIIKDKSAGLITVVLDMKGKVLSEKINSWEKGIVPKVPAASRKKFDDSNIIFHSYVKTNDDQIFAIGELYERKGVPGVTSMSVETRDMIIIHFDEKYEAKSVNLFEKDANKVTLPKGLLAFSSKVLAYIVQSLGGFDYIFTQESGNKETFVVSYIDFDKVKGEKGKNVLGMIVYTPEKVFTLDKFPLNRKSSRTFVYEGKTGYVMISEYFEKDKKLESRLEKINY